MTAHRETGSRRPRVAHTQSTPTCKSRERDASDSIPRKYTTVQTCARMLLESKLRVALTTLMKSECAEPFLLDHCDHGLVGLHTIQERLNDGKYVDAKLFWSDIDECLSLCASAGRHPFLVWEMRSCFQQLEEDFWEEVRYAEVFLDDVSPAKKSFAASACEVPRVLFNGLREFKRKVTVQREM